MIHAQLINDIATRQDLAAEFHHKLQNLKAKGLEHTLLYKATQEVIDVQKEEITKLENRLETLAVAIEKYETRIRSSSL